MKSNERDENRLRKTMDLLLEKIQSWLIQDRPKQITMAQAIQVLEIATRIDLLEKGRDGNDAQNGNESGETLTAELVAAVKKIYGDDVKL